MWPLLAGKVPGERTLYWRTFHAEAVRRGHYKLIRQSDSGSVELYDLESDPSESRDLTSEKPGLAKQMVDVLDQHRILGAVEIIPFMEQRE
jgi:arylsulfatase A-like enzyme